MRASAEILGSLIMITIVLILGLAFMSLFVSQFQRISEERAKIEEMGRVRTSIEVALVYSANKTRGGTSVHEYVVEFVNVGGKEASVYIAVGAGEADFRFPRVTSGDVRVYHMKRIAVVNLNECDAPPYPCGDRSRLVISPSKIFTEEEIPLSVLGSTSDMAAAKLDLPAKGGKALYVVYNLPQEWDRPLLLVLAFVNGKYYLASFKELPRGATS